MNRFILKYEAGIKSQDPKLLCDAEDFSSEVDLILQFKVTVRSIKKQIGGIAISLGILVVLSVFLLSRFGPIFNTLQFISLLFPPIVFSDGINSVEFFYLQLISGAFTAYLLGVYLLGFTLPSFLVGYIVGEEKQGAVSALILGGVVGIITFIGGLHAQLILGQFNIFWWFLIYSPLLFFMFTIITPILD